VNRRFLNPSAFKTPLILACLATIAILIQGYHPGLEDDAYYLAAIKKNLNPALFPGDSDFFRLQFQATIFDKLIAWSVQSTHLTLAWNLLLWQFVSIFLTLACCWRIACQCFKEAHERWAAVALVAALLTIPISGTGLSLVDQYLHPRTLATVAILAAIAATLERRLVMASLLLATAAAMHVIMASFGISLCIILAWTPAWKRPIAQGSTVAALALPMGWIWDTASPAWREAAATRTFYFLLQWQWFEWLGVFAPLLLLYLFGRVACRNGDTVMSRFATRLVWFGWFQLVVALAVMLPPGLERLRPLEPMRFLHLIYLFLFLLMGGLIGRYILGKHRYRWALLFAPLSFGMWYAQDQMFPATEHLELPGSTPHNQWVKAFTWISENTPIKSVFALDPYYMRLSGEDYHGFRAIAERSVLADNLKDPGMVARVPRLAGRWLTEVTAESNWTKFQSADFQRLKTEFGVNWVVLVQPGVSGLSCPYQDRLVVVCRVE
jgi:hypothetical protein